MSAIEAMQVLPRAAPTVQSKGGGDAAVEPSTEAHLTPFAQVLAEANARPANGSTGADSAWDPATDDSNTTLDGSADGTSLAAAVMVAATVALPTLKPDVQATSIVDMSQSSQVMPEQPGPVAVSADVAQPQTNSMSGAKLAVELPPSAPVAAAPVVVETALAAAGTDSKPVVEGAVAKPTPLLPEGEAASVAVTFNRTSVAPKPEAATETAAPSLTVAIRAAAARIGQGLDVEPEGRRVGGVAIASNTSEVRSETAPESGSSVTLGDLLQQAIDGTSKGPAHGETSGESDGNAAAEILKLTEAHKPSAEAAPAANSAPTELGGLAGNTGAVKSPSGVAVDPKLALAPESVTIREAGDAVIRSVRYLSGKTDEVVTVRLVPRSLGELQVAVRSSGDGVDVVLTASTTTARDAIQGGLDGLRQAMSRQGIDVNRVTVQVFGHFDAGYQAASGQQGQPGYQGQAGQTPRSAPWAYRDPAGPGAGGGGQEQDRRQRHEGRLNMWA
jgi:flagellar hook-length control protein FliK